MPTVSYMGVELKPPAESESGEWEGWLPGIIRSAPTFQHPDLSVIKKRILVASGIDRGRSIR